MKNNKKYTSRKDENRLCGRIDKTTYRYKCWDDNIGAFNIVNVSVEDEELLDYMQMTDNADAQDTEDFFRYTVQTDDDNFDPMYELVDNISYSYEGISGPYSISTAYIGSPELLGPEAVLFPEEQETDEVAKAVNEYIRWQLSEENRILLELTMADVDQEEIAKQLPPKKNGKHITQQAVSKRWNKLKEEIIQYVERKCEAV